jgi:hypothetical protein
MRVMSEIPEHSYDPTGPVATSTLPPPPPETPADRTVVAQHDNRRPNRLFQVAAWVAIVAGTLFIVAVVFFSGFALGLHSGGSGHFGHRHWHNGMIMGRGEPPMMRPGGGPGFYPGGPGGSGPGPGNFGPGQGQGPGQSPGQPTPTKPTR